MIPKQPPSKLIKIPTEYLIDSQGKIGKIQFGAISNADAEAAFKEMN